MKKVDTLNKSQIKPEFIKTTYQIQKEQGIAEICAVLNQMSMATGNYQGEDFIGLIDEIIDNLYRKNKLAIPGHRWLSGPKPSTIRRDLLLYFQEGYIWQDKETNLWHHKELRWYYQMTHSLQTSVQYL